MFRKTACSRYRHQQSELGKQLEILLYTFARDRIGPRGGEIGHELVDVASAVDQHQEAAYRFVLQRHAAMAQTGDDESGFGLAACEQAGLGVKPDSGGESRRRP